nr:hypothetical transcript [Hymenolepis microstoma]
MFRVEVGDGQRQSEGSFFRHSEVGIRECIVAEVMIDRERRKSPSELCDRRIRAAPERDRSSAERNGVGLRRSPENNEHDEVPKSKIPKKKPTDQDLALNYFIKQLANELLDRRLTIIQQPRHRLAQLEAACKRQFPAFNDRQIRLKIRAQLKLYRRNLKKAEERKLAKPISFNPQSGQFEKLSLPIVGQNRSCFPSNSNAISMAHRALANERKREMVPLKSLNNMQNIGITLNPVIMSKPSTENALVSRRDKLEAIVNFKHSE